MASCPQPLGSGTRLFWTFVGQEEGREPHPRKVAGVSPCWTEDAWDSNIAFEVPLKKHILCILPFTVLK